MKELSFKRRRMNITDYKKRFKLLVSGKPRFVVRVTNKRIITQIIEYQTKGDKTLIAVDSKMLDLKNSLKNTSAAYLTGLLCGVKAKEKNVKEAILDIGLRTPTKGSRVFAALKGGVDAGLNIPHEESILPTPERIKGKNPDFEKIKEKILKAKK